MDVVQARVEHAASDVVAYARELAHFWHSGPERPHALRRLERALREHSVLLLEAGLSPLMIRDAARVAVRSGIDSTPFVSQDGRSDAVAAAEELLRQM